MHDSHFCSCKIINRFGAHKYICMYYQSVKNKLLFIHSLMSSQEGYDLDKYSSSETNINKRKLPGESNSLAQPAKQNFLG